MLLLLLLLLVNEFYILNDFNKFYILQVVERLHLYMPLQVLLLHTLSLEHAVKDQLNLAHVTGHIRMNLHKLANPNQCLMLDNG